VLKFDIVIEVQSCPHYKELLWDIWIITLLQAKPNIVTIILTHKRPFHLITLITQPGRRLQVATYLPYFRTTSELSDGGAALFENGNDFSWVQDVRWRGRIVVGRSERSSKGEGVVYMDRPEGLG
jgi:hypothetical protein